MTLMLLGDEAREKAGDRLILRENINIFIILRKLSPKICVSQKKSVPLREKGGLYNSNTG